MPIDYELEKLTIKEFRGIQSLELDFHTGKPVVLIGANNSGKSTVLNAIALALGAGGYHQWSPSETDFFCSKSGSRSKEFVVQLHFKATQESNLPAIKGVGQPTLVHGIQVKGKFQKSGRITHSRTLIDRDGKSITFAPRSPLSAKDKETFSEHDIGYKLFNARVDDIRDHMPDVWFFKPQNIEASLYIWRTGPLAKLANLLAEKFLSEPWVLKRDDGDRRMPETMRKAYSFFQESVAAFPFWVDDMKPRLERIFGRYVGNQSTIDLQPSTQAFESWLAQQLTISLATDPESAPTPLRNMGDGWQSVIRLAALEALSEYPQLAKERLVLLIEEPETHLHPHLRRKMRKVLLSLSEKGWLVAYSTHSPELVSFDESAAITRLVRAGGEVVGKSVLTDAIESSAKFQSKIDDRGAHDFLFGSCCVFCEGRDDSFAVKSAFDKTSLDYESRSVSVTQCGSVSAVPAFVAIASRLGIKWCALTDEDTQDDGTIKPSTQRSRDAIERNRSEADIQVQWKGDLERALSVKSGKATPDVVVAKLAESSWQEKYPDFASTIDRITKWIETENIK